MLISVFSRIAIIFIILAVGALARFCRVLTKETTEGLCRIAIEVTLPFLYFYTLSTQLTRELLFSIWSFPIIAIILVFFSYFLIRIVAAPLKLNTGQRSSFLFLGTFTNYGFLGIPIIYALFGQEALTKLIVFNLGVTFLYWTFGVAILSGPRAQGFGIFRNLANNSTLALILGLIAGVGSFAIPEFILESSKLIGNASIPLALIVVGSILAQKETKRQFSLKTIFILVFCRLILIPALVILILNIFDGLPKILAAIIVLQAAMPSASTTPILARRFGADTQFAASGVFFTTLLSIVSLPLFITLVLR